MLVYSDEERAERLLQLVLMPVERELALLHALPVSVPDCLQDAVLQHDHGRVLSELGHHARRSCPEGQDELGHLACVHFLLLLD